MSETTRTFFAIEIPHGFEAKLVRLQEELSPDIPGCRWSASATFHLTLAFLGDVSDHDLGRLHELVASKVCGFEPIDLRFEGLGAFPSPRRPGVLWAGLHARAPELLSNIRASVVAAAAESGYPCEDDRFNPHVTLGRFQRSGRRPFDLTPIVERYRSWSCGAYTAVDVVEFASRTGLSGPTYEALRRAPLCGEKSRSLP